LSAAREHLVIDRDGRSQAQASAALANAFDRVRPARRVKKTRKWAEAIQRIVDRLVERRRDSFRVRKTDFSFHGFTATEVKRFRAAISRIRFSRRRLRVKVYENAQLTRLRPRADGTMVGGLFDRHGAPIREAQVHREGEGTIVGSEIPDDSTGPEIVELAIFGGTLFSGFGHIILESACRLWAAERYPDVPIIFQSLQESPSCEQTLLDLAALFGIAPERIRFATRNILLKRAIVPQPGLTLGKEIRREYLRFVHSRPTASDEGQPRPEQVFLSRARLNWRQRRAVGESLLEKAVRGASMKIIRPETRTLAEQVAIQDHAGRIAGFIGSQFHTLFLRINEEPIDVLYLCSARPNANFFQIDLLFPGRRVYGNVSLYEPFFEFGNRCPFYFSAERTEQLFREIGLEITGLSGADTAMFAFEWSLAFFYFKVFRQGLLSGDFTKTLDARLRVVRKNCSRKLTEDEQSQIVRAYRECMRRCRVPDDPEVLAGAERVSALLAEIGVSPDRAQ
jgi:hypothetical protein